LTEEKTAASFGVISGKQAAGLSASSYFPYHSLRQEDQVVTDLETLSARKLQEVIARRNKRWGETLDATIAAGMGDARYSDMVEYAKGSSLLARTRLARDYLNASLDYTAAHDELDARKRYHGSDKPIKRSPR
jgi:hypothetical protein